MTQAQLNSMAKRINTQLVQHAKTFGVRSKAYKQFEAQIINRIGEANVHKSASGHIQINLGKYLAGKEAQLKILDAPEMKVKHKKAQAEKILMEVAKEKGKPIKKKDIKKSQITKLVGEITSVETFFDDIGSIYVLENEIPELREELDKLRSKGNKTYSELLRIIRKINKLVKKYDEEHKPEELSQDEIEERVKRGTKL